MERCRADGRPVFTLIEMLVVIAILAILASVPLPALPLAQKAGRRGADRIQPSDGVVIQDRRDGGTVTEPNIIQQTNLWLAFASHYARSGAALWRESCGGQGRA